jgi:hypothetical protein
MQTPPLEVFYHKTHGKRDDKIFRIADLRHNALKVDLRHGKESYVLDPSGAQFGYFEPVIPWGVYKESTIRVHKYNESFKFGLIKDCIRSGHEDWMGDLEVGSTVNLFCNLRWRAAERLFIETMKWEKEPKISIKDMLQLPEMAFDIRRKELVEHVDAHLNAFLENRSRYRTN